MGGLIRPWSSIKPSATSWSTASMRYRIRCENLFLLLRLIPQRIHFLKRCTLERAALRRKPALDVAKAAFKFHVGAAQGEFRIDAGMPRQIDQREQQIAGFFGEFAGVATIEGCFDLIGFLANFA